MHFKFSPNILNRLGEELIPNPDQGIIELVKNAYDADATKCTVELINTSNIGGSIIISDNGTGMDTDAISEGWLVLGRSKKAARQPTLLGRLPVGDKGLGRLAALRQGSQVYLKTRPKNEPGFEYSLIINWDVFEGADVVEDVSFDAQKNSTEKSQGTDITIHNLKVKLGRLEIKRLARELLLLADPFDNSVAFRPRLIAPGFSDIEKKVNEAYFEAAQYHLKASLNAEGTVEARLLDWKGDELFSAKHENISKAVYKSVPAEFEMWVFLLNPQNFSAKKVSSAEVRSWLTEVGGVHLYHRGLRVKPYGDRTDDWLNINLARARNPEVRPSTSTVIGRVIAIDPDDFLVQKTDRLGFIENEAFLELRRFAVDVLEWMAKERLKETEKKREDIKQESSQDVEDVKIRLEQVIEEEIPQEENRAKVRQVVKQYETAKEREIKALRDDLQLYRSLATAGTTAAVFAHESSKPVTQIEKIAKRIESKGKELLQDKYPTSLQRPVEMLYQISSSWKQFSNFPLHLLKREKRRSGVVDIHSVIDANVELFQPFFDDAKIEIKKHKAEQIPHIRGSIALVEAILTNLLTNTINAFNVEGACNQGRQIIISTEILGNYVGLKVSDNGLGIKDIELHEIWLPGLTTTPGSTGFGLTIVKDSVRDMGGKVRAIGNGELGGAEFLVELPLSGN
ncbi:MULTISPECIES: sensor histidine kinase [unclassified Microcoleus]|uniref:sensor histidine kinase n=1 Tax=unclassified Microcoleus TaxID=2642155 RepID=UPI002FCFB40D